MSSMKDKILQRFLTASGEPISGQLLADEFNVSRTAIWKHMQTLQQEGYRFEAVKKKGYRLLEKSTKMDRVQIELNLQTKRYGRTIYHFDEVTSTQVIAHDLVQKGVEDGTIVLAETQTEGRGRMQRFWESKEHDGIWMTVIICPEILPHQAPQFTLVTAVAITQAMKKMFTNFIPSIKWPNDVLINGKKCVGILTEMIAETDCVKALLIGIGINVNQMLDDFPEELHSIATSIAIEEGKTVDRALLVANFLYELEKYSEVYVNEGFSSIKEEWEKASGTIGKQVRATTVREVVEGKAIGITENGVLQIRIATGEVKGIYSADIEILNF